MTNGEMIRVMFPKTIFIHSIKADDERAMIYSNEWWNDSYKGNVIPISVIENIKTEIEKELCHSIRDEYSQRQNDYCDGVEFAGKRCLEIIDNHISAKENE